MLALHLDVQDKLVLVVGGGPIGRRRASTLLDAGARVRLVTLEPAPADFAHPALVWMTEPVREDHLAGVHLVVTATNPQLDAQVANWARQRGLWVNVASDANQGNVAFPAQIQRGRLLVSVGTQGAAPALAVHLRARIEALLPDSLAIWLELLEEARELAQNTLPPGDARQALARELASLDGPALLAEHGLAVLQAWLRQRVQQAGDNGSSQ